MSALDNRVRLGRLLLRLALGALVLASALGLRSPSATAQSAIAKGEMFCDQGASDPSLTIVYANGEFASFAQAMEGLDRLVRSVPGHLNMPRSELDFGLAFNYDEDLTSKAAHVARLAAEEQGIDHIRRFAYDLDVPVRFLEWAQGAVADVVSVFSKVPFTDKLVSPDSDLWTHVQMYQDYVKRGRKVVVVGHSVGSLYTNRALFFLENQPAAKYIAAVGVGTLAQEIRGPAAGCGSGGCYVNRADDLLVAAVPSALPGNVAGDPDLGGALHHDFLTAYMGDPFVRGKLLDRIKDQVRGLRTPRPSIGDGPLRASLRWESGRDLDLHVFEADHTAHVAYDNPKGLVGELDRDSQTGGSELENYFSHCRRLQAGAYDFAVNFYAGASGPVTADLHLWLGDRNFQVSKTFYDPLGEEGYLAPPPLATLVLEEAGEDWFYYELHVDEARLVSAED